MLAQIQAEKNGAINQKEKKLMDLNILQQVYLTDEDINKYTI